MALHVETKKWVTTKRASKCCMWGCRKSIPVGSKAIMVSVRDTEVPDMKPDINLFCSGDCFDQFTENRLKYHQPRKSKYHS